MKTIRKEYKIFEDGKDTGRTVAFIVPYKTERVNEAFKRLKEDYSEEKGYLLMHVKDTIENI